MRSLTYRDREIIGPPELTPARPSAKRIARSSGPKYKAVRCRSLPPFTGFPYRRCSSARMLAAQGSPPDRSPVRSKVTAVTVWVLWSDTIRACQLLPQKWMASFIFRLKNAPATCDSVIPPRSCSIFARTSAIVISFAGGAAQPTSPTSAPAMMAKRGITLQGSDKTSPVVANFTPTLVLKLKARPPLNDLAPSAIGTLAIPRLTTPRPAEPCPTQPCLAKPRRHLIYHSLPRGADA